MVDVRPLAPSDVAEHLDDLARLRITVFAQWPYLYDGDAAYERSYLTAYLESPGAFIAGAFDGDIMVGACTASPLNDHHSEFAKPLIDAGFDTSRMFYFGESVLQPEYRGQGIGHRFFDLREREAKRQAFDVAIFSAVIRPDDHPMKPADYVPLDAFWTRRGYRKLDSITTSFGWKDFGDDAETDKPMAYWMKSLTD